MTKGHAVVLYGLVQTVLPASVWNIANGQSWFPRNLGEPCSLLSEFPAGDPDYQPQALAVHSSTRERMKRVNAEVPPSEGNEVRRDSCRAS